MGLSRFWWKHWWTANDFMGGYRASNWIELGETTGRGRSDKTNTPNKALAKTILVYPLVKNAIDLLKEGGT